jgi:esterase
MSYREMTADIITLLNDLNIAQCDLIGHSMGGKVAMTLALHYSQRVRCLVVVDIAPKAYSPKHQAILYAMLSLPLKTIKQRKQAEQWLSSAVSSPVERGFLLKNLKRNATGLGFYWQCYLSEIAKNYLKISSFHLDKQQRYTAPTLFIKGGQSDYIQTQDHTLIQQHFPNSEIQCLEQAGHLPHVEDSQGFYRLLSKFLQ